MYINILKVFKILSKAEFSYKHTTLKITFAQQAFLESAESTGNEKRSLGAQQSK